TYDTTSFDPDRSLVFLVEPTESLRRDICSVLREADIDVTVFAGLESLHAHGRRETPDLILLSAEDAGARDPLQLLHERYPATPVIMTREATASSGAPPQQRSGPLFLPCSPRVLLRRVRGAIGFNRWTHDLSALPTIATGTIDIDIDTPRQVLVVDADPLARQVLAYHLKRHGCEVTEAADGHEAMSRLATEVFDLVCLDLDLPFRSGLELLEFMQRQEERGPGVVVVSGVKRKEDVMQAFAMGALDYVKKPLDGAQVEQRLRRVLYD
ncbi:MAG: response regulator, partial [Myxococcota bacterium]